MLSALATRSHARRHESKTEYLYLSWFSNRHNTHAYAWPRYTRRLRVNHTVIVSIYGFCEYNTNGNRLRKGETKHAIENVCFAPHRGARALIVSDNTRWIIAFWNVVNRRFVIFSREKPTNFGNRTCADVRVVVVRTRVFWTASRGFHERYRVCCPDRNCGSLCLEL